MAWAETSATLRSALSTSAVTAGRMARVCEAGHEPLLAAHWRGMEAGYTYAASAAGEAPDRDTMLARLTAAGQEARASEDRHRERGEAGDEPARRHGGRHVALGTARAWALTL